MSTALAGKNHYTFVDYQLFPDDERWEIIDGEAHAMSPSPAVRHQRISLQLLTELIPYFRKGPCVLFHAPMDVKLSEFDIVQPDLLVVCDSKKIKETHIEGAPDLVVEILSLSSIPHDRLRKMRLYAQFGVKEYWLVTPDPPLIEVLALEGDSYRIASVYGQEDKLVSRVFPDLSFTLKEVFDSEI